MPHTLALELGATPSRTVIISHAVIAGWTGRDAAAVDQHIRELEALGVRPPSTTPIYYRVATTRVTTQERMQVLGNASSGEVEFVLLKSEGKLWVGVGSDHTDRDVEAYEISVSKQMCDKPVSRQFWDYTEVEPHWDRLVLRSFVHENGARTLYQEGPVTAMRDPRELIALYTGGTTLTEGTLMFCGTLAAHGGVRPSPVFECELSDPVLGRTLLHKYTVQSLPMAT